MIAKEMLAMILVKITDDLNGARVVVTGHANYAPKGKDIVCSAVSTLVQHTIYNSESYVKSNEDGNYNVLFDTSDRDTYVLLLSFIRSIKQLAKQYPDYIKVVDEYEI